MRINLKTEVIIGILMRKLIEEYIKIEIVKLLNVLIISRARISRPYKKLTIILLVAHLVVHLLNKIIVNFL